MTLKLYKSLESYSDRNECPKMICSNGNFVFNPQLDLTHEEIILVKTNDIEPCRWLVKLKTNRMKLVTSSDKPSIHVDFRILSVLRIILVDEQKTSRCLKTVTNGLSVSQSHLSEQNNSGPHSIAMVLTSCPVFSFRQRHARSYVYMFDWWTIITYGHIEKTMKHSEKKTGQIRQNQNGDFPVSIFYRLSLF